MPLSPVHPTQRLVVQEFACDEAFADGARDWVVHGGTWYHFLQSALGDRMSVAFDHLCAALYQPSEAARLAGLAPGRVRRWLKGYQYRYESEIRRQSPVICRLESADPDYASFLDLVDLLFVKRFLDHGVSLQKLRRSLDEATRILGTSHFARQTFFTDGRNVYLEVKDEGRAILQLLHGGQWVIAPIIRQLAIQIDFDHTTGLARRWFPRGPEGRVVVDPCVSFGRPTITCKGVATSTVFDLFVAEKRNVTAVASWLNLTDDEVRAAVDFEERLAA